MEKGREAEHNAEEKEMIDKLLQIRNVLELRKFEGMDRKMKLKPQEWGKDTETGEDIVTEAVFSLKWGGELTHSGV